MQYEACMLHSIASVNWRSVTCQGYQAVRGGACGEWLTAPSTSCPR